MQGEANEDGIQCYYLYCTSCSDGRLKCSSGVDDEERGEEGDTQGL